MRGTDSRDEWATLSMPKCFQAPRENPCPALRMQKNHTSALGSLQLVGEADLDTTNHATMAACEERVDQMHTARIGCNRGCSGKTANARGTKASWW